MRIIFADEHKPIAPNPTTSTGKPLAGIVVDFETRTITAGQITNETYSPLRMVFHCNELVKATSLNAWLRKNKHELLELLEVFRVKNICGKKRLYYLDVGYCDSSESAQKAMDVSFKRFQHRLSAMTRNKKHLWNIALAADYLDRSHFRYITPDSIVCRYIKGKFTRHEIPILANKIISTARNKGIILCGTVKRLKVLMDSMQP